MSDLLEKEIRNLFCNTGPLDRDEITGLLLGLIDRIQKLEQRQPLTDEQPAQQCNPHPKAPHGFMRDASHSADRYVCECEGWDAYDAGYQVGYDECLKRQDELDKMAENGREFGIQMHPAQDGPVEYWTVADGWVSEQAEVPPAVWVYPEFWDHCKMVGCGTAYRLPAPGRQPLYTRPQAREPLTPVEGDLLPSIGSKVLIHLASQDAWVEHTVVGYYVWGDLDGRENRRHRVFVRVADADGVLNARMLCDVRPVEAAHGITGEKK